MAKREKKNKAPSKRWEKYAIQGENVNRNHKFCPKCGEGFFMADHKDRYTCGNCGYTEFKSHKQKQEEAEDNSKDN